MNKWVSIVVFAAIMLTLVPVAQADTEGVNLRNLAQGLSYEWSEEPSPDYPDSGNQLTDGEYGRLDKSDPAWVGHVRGKTREIVFDLGKKKSISSIKAHFFQDWPTSSILVPLTVSMYVSDDKKNWGTLSHNATKLLWGSGPPREEYYVWDGDKDGIPKVGSNATMAYARYVKVTFSIHTSAWTLLDEIEIWGTDGKVKGAVRVPAEQPAYLEPGEATAGIRNLVLLYNGHYDGGVGNWTKDRITPYISYVNQNGEPVDWFFDGILYLGLLSPEWRNFGIGTANLEDWRWYLDKTFAEQGDMQQLNEATKEVTVKLGEPDHKTKVILMIPNPGEHLTDFGDVDGDGISENFNAAEIGEDAALANREKVIRWWIGQVQQRWNEGDYSNLELVGLYWLDEQVEPSNKGEDVIRYTSRLVHDQNLKFFWIPHFLAYKSYAWKEIGIDAPAFQPNYFFDETIGTYRLEDAANIARQYGMGVEIEFDDRMLTDESFRQRYIDYLDGGIKYGYMQNVFKAYYQDVSTVQKTAVSEDPDIRILYDWLYQFVNGTYGESFASRTLTELSEKLEGYIGSGEVRGPLVNKLQNSLKQATHHFNKGSKKQAAHFMEKFLQHLNDQSMQKNVTEQAKEDLSTKAEALVKYWKE